MANRAEGRASATGLAELLAQGNANTPRRLQEASAKYDFDFLAGEPVQGGVSLRYSWTRAEEKQQEEQKSVISLGMWLP